ncbi:hypothetical protein OEZ85_010431 [Tetradesmus obliquus]|uniref:Uncharacterized protein n=1 Tax=Tetradesmus obliquus TaxID=3088 RepID=A0ABY8TM91_TETOB|nr:hypothetical protein OEZ85_010431 [Tetradesmus obliquus]
MARLSKPAAVLLVLLFAHQTLAQITTTAVSTTTVTTPKTDTKVTFNATETTPEAEKSGAGAGADMMGVLTSAVDKQMSGLHKHLGNVLLKAGVTPEKYEAMMQPVMASTKTMLSGMHAVRGAYEKTLRGFYGLLLDNTKELRKTLEDGNTAIRNIRILRNATCTPAKFTPPGAKPARITGWAGTFTLSSGQCTLTRDPSPLRLDYIVKCTEPGLVLQTRPPRYTSRFVSAAAANSEECKVTRKYGVESTTTITLLDPAAFFAAAAEPAAKAADGEAAPDVEAAGGLNKGAAWYKGMFPINGKAGQRISFVPPGVAEAVAAAMKDIKVDTKVTFNALNIGDKYQAVADSVVSLLEQKFKVAEKVVKIHKEARENWLSPETLLAMKDNSFKSNLAKSIDMSSLFDNIFANSASKLLSGPRAAAATAAAAADVLGQHPMRTLLAKARHGSGQPVALKLHGSLDQALKSVGAFGGAVGETLQAAAQPGSVMEILRKDPNAGQRLKAMADVLQQATEAMRSGDFSKLG